jgi:phosphate acetyltransferase/phosphate butyryltransferase
MLVSLSAALDAHAAGLIDAGVSRARSRITDVARRSNRKIDGIAHRGRAHGEAAAARAVELASGATSPR